MERIASNSDLLRLREELTEITAMFQDGVSRMIALNSALDLLTKKSTVPLAEVEVFHLPQYVLDVTGHARYEMDPRTPIGYIPPPPPRPSFLPQPQAPQQSVLKLPPSLTPPPTLPLPTQPLSATQPFSAQPLPTLPSPPQIAEPVVQGPQTQEKFKKVQESSRPIPKPLAFKEVPGLNLAQLLEEERHARFNSVVTSALNKYREKGVQKARELGKPYSFSPLVGQFIHSLVKKFCDDNKIPSVLPPKASTAGYTGPSFTFLLKQIHGISSTHVFRKGEKVEAFSYLE
jgi:hypothetical protein